MASLQNYAKLSVFYNSNALVQVTSCSMTTNSGQQRVDLMNEGLGGFTPGPGDVSIEVGYALPIGGTEDDFQQDCANGEFVTLQVNRGRHRYIGVGKLMSESVSGSTGANVEGTFSWVGELKPLEG